VEANYAYTTTMAAREIRKDGKDKKKYARYAGIRTMERLAVKE